MSCVARVDPVHEQGVSAVALAVAVMGAGAPSTGSVRALDQGWLWVSCG